MLTDRRAFEHAAAFYAGVEDFVTQVGAFVQTGLARDDAVLVGVGPVHLDALRDVLPHDSVTLLDSSAAGPNPARVLPLWRDFVDSAVRSGRGVTAVGDRAFPGRSDDEYGEIARNEALVEAALGATTSCSILCPYDAASLPQHVLDEVSRTHRVVHGDHRPGTSPAAFDAALALAQLEEPLPAPPAAAVVTTFTAADYAMVRAQVAELCRQDHLDSGRTEDLVLAVHELAANCALHGGGTGTMTTWTTDAAVVVEIASAGRFLDPAAGRVRPDLVREHGRGLWLVNQLCDLVQLRNTPTGNAVRVRLHLP